MDECLKIVGDAMHKFIVPEWQKMDLNLWNYDAAWLEKILNTLVRNAWLTIQYDLRDHKHLHITRETRMANYDQLKRFSTGCWYRGSTWAQVKDEYPSIPEKALVSKVRVVRWSIHFSLPGPTWEPYQIGPYFVDSQIAQDARAAGEDQSVLKQLESTMLSNMTSAIEDDRSTKQGSLWRPKSAALTANSTVTENSAITGQPV